MADVVAIGLRALAMAAALLAAGWPLFLSLCGDLLERSAPSIRKTLLPTALGALALTALYTLVEPVRLAGAWSGLLDPSLHALLLSSSFGAAAAVRVLGLAMIFIGALRPGKGARRISPIGASLVAASFAFTGHTAADPQRWLLAPLLFTHIVAIAFWFGSLRPLSTVTASESAAVAGAVIARFSRTALWITPLILLAGLAMSVLLLPSVASLGTPYGLSLIAKVGGFSLLLALASLNKWRLAPGIALGKRSAATAFRYSVLSETVLIFAVLTITAVMTARFSPGH